MRKIYQVLIILIMLLIPYNSTFAQDLLPKYSSSINVFGMGVCFTPKEIDIYSNPDKTSPVIEHIEWNKSGDLNTEKPFLVFLPEKNIALLTVTDETDDFYQVIYNQKSKETGWIEKNQSEKTMTWLEFMNKYGKDNSLYFFSDLPEDAKKVRVAPQDDAKALKDAIYCFDDINLKLIKGNWMLVKILDFNKNASIGWVRWRDNTGKIFLFPNLTD